MFYADCEGIFSRCVVVARDEYGDWLIDDDLTSEINSAMEGKSADSGPSNHHRDHCRWHDRIQYQEGLKPGLSFRRDIMK